MMRNNLFPIAKEGWSYIGYSFLAFVVFSIFDLDFLEFISFIATLFFLYIYRNPERVVPFMQEGSVVSPVDGVVLSIEEVNDEEYAYKVEIDSSYLNVSVLRVPFSSNILVSKLQRGARLCKFNKLSNKINENAELVFEADESHKLKLTHMLKQSFTKININPVEQQKVLQGERYGVMVNGVTTLYLPKNFRLNVNVGNELEASQTLIGYFS